MDESRYRVEYLQAVYGAIIDQRREEFTFSRTRFAPASEALSGVPRPWAIVSAWNPMSRPHDDSTNRQRDAELQAAIARAGWMSLPAWGRNTSGTWVEESWLVQGCPRGQVITLARAFEQRAIVWCEGPQVGLLDSRTGVWLVRRTTNFKGSGCSQT